MVALFLWMLAVLVGVVLEILSQCTLHKVTCGCGLSAILISVSVKFQI